MLWPWSYKPDATQEEKDAMQAAFDDIDKISDRAAAIVAASFVDDYLTDALKGRLHHYAAPMKQMFRSSGPLGSFSSKIDFALLTGLLSEAAWRELHTVRDIRNRFAHKGIIRDFESQSIRELTNNLRLIDAYKLRLVPVDEDAAPDIVVPWEPAQTPRERYIRTCQMFLTAFHFRAAPIKPAAAPVI